MIKAMMRRDGQEREVLIMFGQEFTHHVRGNQPGVIQMTDGRGRTVSKVEFDDIICDLCNASVAPAEPMAMAGNYAYCWACVLVHITPFLTSKVSVK